MKIDGVANKTEYIKSKYEDLNNAINDMYAVIEVFEEIQDASIPEQHTYLQKLMGKTTDIRRVVGAMSQRVPDIQEEIRDMITDLEDYATREGL